MASDLADALTKMVADHPTPWRTAELSAADYWDSGTEDDRSSVAWVGIVDANGRRTPFGFETLWPRHMGETPVEEHFVDLAALVNLVAATLTN